MKTTAASHITCDISSDEILQFLASQGKLNIDDVRQSMMNMERQKILEAHPYKIWQGKDGKWRTYLPDDTKPHGRRLVKKVTQEKLQDEIIKVYHEPDTEQEQPVVFRDMYLHWLEFQTTMVGSPNTLYKYKTDYRRFFEGRELEKMPVADLNEEIIKSYIMGLVKELNLNQRSCKALCGYIKNTLQSAKVNKVISENPFDNISNKIFYKYCKKKVAKAGDRTVSGSQMELLNEQFEKDHQKKPNYIPTYAVQMASLTGLRAGELSALEWTDLDTENQVIIIRKSEKQNRETKEFFIDSTKNGEERFMPLTEPVIILLERIYQVEKEYGYLSSYIFSGEKGRIHAPVISSCAKNKCKQIGIPYKSIHSYRRTFSSKLKCNGVSTTIVSSVMGHTEEVNEHYYTYDVSELNQKRAALEVVTTEISNQRGKSNQEKQGKSNHLLEHNPINLLPQTGNCVQIGLKKEKNCG